MNSFTFLVLLLSSAVACAHPLLRPKRGMGGAGAAAADCTSVCGLYDAGRWNKAKAKLTSITLKYLGSNANDLKANAAALPRIPGSSATKQPTWKLRIDTPGPDAEPVVSIVGDKLQVTQVATNVKIGGMFTVTNGGYPLPADMSLQIVADREGSSAKWTVKFHSSCSHGLEIGDQYGSLEIVGFKDNAQCTLTTEATTTATTVAATTTTAAPNTTTVTTITTTTDPGGCLEQRFRGPLKQRRGRSNRLSNTPVNTAAACAVKCAANRECHAFSVKTDTTPLRCWQYHSNGIVLERDVAAHSLYQHYYEDATCISTPPSVSSTRTSATITTTATTTVCAKEFKAFAKNTACPRGWSGSFDSAKLCEEAAEAIAPAYKSQSDENYATPQCYVWTDDNTVYYNGHQSANANGKCSTCRPLCYRCLTTTTTPTTTTSAATATSTTKAATASSTTAPTTIPVRTPPPPPFTLQPGPTEDLPGGGRPTMPTRGPEFTVKPATASKDGDNNSNDAMIASKTPTTHSPPGINPGINTVGGGGIPGSGSGSFWSGSFTYEYRGEKNNNFPSTTTDLASADGTNANTDTDVNHGVNSPTLVKQTESSFNKATLFTTLAAVFGVVVLVGVLVLAKWKVESKTEGKATLNPLRRPQNRLLPTLPAPLTRASSGRQYRSEMLVSDSATFDHASSQQMLDLLRGGDNFNNPLVVAAAAGTLAEYDDVAEAQLPSYLVPGQYVLDAPTTRALVVADNNDDADDNNSSVRLSTSYATPMDDVLHEQQPTAKYEYHDSRAPNQNANRAAATAAAAGKGKGKGKGEYDCMRGDAAALKALAAAGAAGSKGGGGGYAKVRDSSGVEQRRVNGGGYAPIRKTKATVTVTTTAMALEVFDEPMFNTPFDYIHNGNIVKVGKEDHDEDQYHFPSALPVNNKRANKSANNSTNNGYNAGQHNGGAHVAHSEIASAVYADITTTSSLAPHGGGGVLHGGNNSSVLPMMTTLASNAMQLKVKQSEHAQYQLAPPSTYQANMSAAANEHMYASEPLRTPSYTTACSPPGSRRISPTYESAELLFARDEGDVEPQYPPSVVGADYQQQHSADYAVHAAGGKGGSSSSQQKKHTPATASDYHAMFAEKRMQMQVSSVQVEVQEEQGREYTYIPRKGMKPSNKVYDQPYLTPANRSVGEVGDDYLDFC